MSRVPALALLAAALGSCASGPRPLEHTVTFVHPGDPKSTEMVQVLEQFLDDRGDPREYRMWVDSVICREQTCDVVKVQLVWDALGRYREYDVEPGEKLTKKDHVPFSAADHRKLHGILLDKESPLKEVTKEGLTGPRAEAGVDGVAGPTLLTLSSTVVVGAGYTCYDLWHWANGGVADLVRDLSGKTCSVEALREHLASGDSGRVAFALEHLRERELFDAATRKAVVEAAPHATDAALAYLLGTDGYHDAVVKIFAEATSEVRVKLLRALASDEPAEPAGFYDRLTASLATSREYLEVQLLLGLVEKRGASSPAVTRNVLPLLDHERFFIARRACWFLEKQELDPAARKALEAFKARHPGRF